MNDDGRPDPDQLLRVVNAQEREAHKGQLRIFFGMSAGVGKTYAMLRAAQQRLKEGVDVVAGVVETHGRGETAALMENLPLIPRKKLDYKGTSLEEMDLDAILARKPKLVLVDELAHSNIPGSRHSKRYQDVIELLDRGIDVYTTINVQHLESRKEAVEAIAQIPIRETVPDSILERAHQVELVDIAPSELLKRLHEGKVYLGDKAQRASENFFKEDRLTALREIALRLTAERVDQDLRRFTDAKQAATPWQTNERLMVAVSHSPYSEKLIRATRRIAYNLEAPWIALHVDTGVPLNNEDQTQLVKNINLARELKAEVVTTTDISVVDALRRVSRQKNVTQIIVGRPTKRWIKDFVKGGTLLDRLVRESGDVDVHVIRKDMDLNYHPPVVDTRRIASGFGTFLNYWYSFWFITVIGVASALLEPFFGYRAVGFVFLLAVLVVGMMAPMGPVVFAATLSALGWNFFFIPPRLTFVVSEPEDVMMCVFYFAVALIIGFLTNRIRSHERLIRDREERTNTLYEVLQDIAASRDKSEFLIKVNERMGHLLNGTCGVLLRALDGRLMVNETKLYGPSLNEKERAVAIWAFEAGKSAGWSTDTLSEARSLYIPLKSSGESVGVFIYQPDTKRILSLEQENLLYSVARQLAISLEKHFFEKRLREAEKLEESEKLHQTLLNSISHEMRTPLTVIMGTATALADPATPKNAQHIEALAGNLLEASDRLNRVIENLLDMTRLNSGVLTLKKEWHDVHDLVGVVLKKLKVQMRNHQVTTIIPEDFPMVEMDFRMMEHALSNLLINASMYVPPEAVVLISAKHDDRHAYITVQDHGPGIPESSLPKIFDKFYRVTGSKPGGTGLGLSIVKSIVEAHKGSVSAENVPDGGVRFTLELPLSKSPPLPKEEA